MVDYKQILRLRAEGVSQRAIADVMGCSRNTVSQVCAAADREGISFDVVRDRSCDEVRGLLRDEKERVLSGRVEPDFEYIHKEMARPHVTLVMLWDEYAAKCRTDGGVPYQTSRFNELYRRWVRSTGASMRIQRQPGEAVEVDWAGDTMEYFDPVTGEEHTAWVFVAALSYSAYAYVEAFADMRMGSWVTAHIHAFEYFGGSARLLIPDNLRTGVSRSDRYEPALNPTYARLAEHYNTAVIPARVRRPRDKATVEGSVRFVAGRIQGMLRDRLFFGLGELNEALFERLEDINSRPFQKREDSRAIVFHRDEAPLLNPLPRERFELAELRKAKVAVNYHIQVEKNFYSVPHSLIGQSLDVRITLSTIEVFNGGDKVASHTRLKGVYGRYQTTESHMPEQHRNRLSDWTPERFVSWANSVGPGTRKVIEGILRSRKIVEQSFRSCLGVMSLAKKAGGSKRLEQTCISALSVTQNPSYTLVKKLWSTWEETPPEPSTIGDKGFVRGADYYSQTGSTK